MLLRELGKQEFADMLKGKYSEQGLIDLFIYLDEESQETGEDIVIGKAPYTVEEITSAFFEWESVEHYNSVKGTTIKSHFDLDYDKDVFVFLAPTNDDDTAFWTME